MTKNDNKRTLSRKRGFEPQLEAEARFYEECYGIPLFWNNSEGDGCTNLYQAKGRI